MAIDRSLTWLPISPSSAKQVIRSAATAWSHRSQGRKNSRKPQDGRHVLRLLLAPAESKKTVTPVCCPDEAFAQRHSISGQDHRLVVADVVNTPATQQILLRKAEVPSLVATKDSKECRAETFMACFGPLAGRVGHEWALQVCSSMDDDVLFHSVFNSFVSGLLHRAPDSTPDSINRNIRRQYAATLPHLRKRLNDVHAVQQSETLILTFLLSLQEMIIFNNPVAWMTHIAGMMHIVQLRGPFAWISEPDFQTFRLFRHFALGLDLLSRRPSFLASRDWMTVPFADRSRSLVDRAIDHCLQVPGLFHMYDECRSGNGCSPEHFSKTIAEYAATLSSFQDDSLCTCPAYLARFGPERIGLEEIIVAILDCSISDLEYSQAVAIHLSNWLFLTRFGVEDIDILPLSSEELVESLLGICEECSCRREGAGVLAWVLPLRVALLTPLKVPKLASIDISHRLDRWHSVGLMTEIMNSLPGFDTKLSLHC